MTKEEKQKYQRTAAYVLWHLEKWIPVAISEVEAVKKEQRLGEADLTAVQITTWKALLAQIKEYKRQYKEITRQRACEKSEPTSEPTS